MRFTKNNTENELSLNIGQTYGSCCGETSYTHEEDGMYCYIPIPGYEPIERKITYYN